jgi:MFS family permease
MEIAFTRLFSVLLFYHYVFLVLAVALLGLGLGAAAVLALPDRARRAESYAAGAATLAAVSAVAAAVLSARLLPVELPLLHGLIALPPFLLAGMAMSLLLVAAGAERTDGASATVYGADLAGAAAGAVGGYALLYLGATTAILGAAVAIAAGGWVVGRAGASGRGDRTALVAALAVLFAVNAVLRPLDVDLGRIAAGKPLGQWLERRQAEVVRTTWDPFGRVDVVRNPEDPLERFVFVDGAAGSALPRYPSDPSQETRRLTELGAFPYRLLDAERVLVIGSGGGLGVLYALLSGIEEITAVEVSRGVVDAVRADGEYAGFLYDRPEVEVVVDEGRSFLDRATGRYDVIDLSLVVSLATARSGYALTENHLFTEEAFASVLAHLTDDGIAAVRLYDDPTLTRAFVTAAAAITDAGVSDAEAVRHLAVVFNPSEADRGGPTFYPMLLISKRPMTETASRELAARAETLGFTVMFAPYTDEEGPFGAVARGEATLDGILGDLQGGVFTPPTDDRPFFFEMTGGLPATLADVWLAVAATVVAGAAGLAIAARRAGRPVAEVRRLGGGLVYFAALGVAFMLVEIALLARFALFLGHPTVVLVVVLAALLAADGAGSVLSGRVESARLGRLVPLAAAAAALLALAVPWLVEVTRVEASTLPLALRIALAALALVPLGVAMGALFPSGLRLVPVDAALPWAVNGVAAVVGSVVATTAAIRFGYPAVSAGGAVVYLALALFAPVLLRAPAADVVPLGRRRWIGRRRSVSHRELPAETG